MAYIQGICKDEFLARRARVVAFVMNKHVEAGGLDERALRVLRAAYDSLAVAA